MVFDNNNNNVTSMYDYFQINANIYIYIYINANKMLILAHKLAYHYTLATHVSLLKASTYPFIAYYLCTI